MSKRIRSEWPEHDLKKLEQLWSDGMPTANIALEMGKTKSSICAKARRLNLPMRQVSYLRGTVKQKPLPSGGHAWREYKAERKNTAIPEEVRKDIAKKSFGETVSPADRKSCQCLWPIGDPKEAGFSFCGAPVTKKNYCAEHAKIAYVPQKSLRHYEHLK